MSFQEKAPYPTPSLLTLLPYPIASNERIAPSFIRRVDAVFPTATAMVFLLAQKWMIAGLTAGGVQG
ncbi:MAG: hypothetical protein ACI8WM_001062 [Burkholderiaceae bacterium]|jgi:hypothetical protein